MTVVEESTISNLSVVIHPLPLINITDQITRYKVQNNKVIQPELIKGVFLGTFEGNNLTISNSFELKVEAGSGVIDKAFWISKQEKMKEMFPNLEPIGFYRLASEPTQEDLNFITQDLDDLIDSPIFFIFDQTKLGSKEFPMEAYEPTLLSDTFKFGKVPMSLGSDAAQRIAVSATVTETKTAELTPEMEVASRLNQQMETLDLLLPKLDLIVDYLEAVQAGELPIDQQILTTLGSIPNLISRKKTDNPLYQAYDNVAIGSLLTNLIQQLKDVQTLYLTASDFHILSKPKSRNNSGPQQKCKGERRTNSKGY